MSGATTIEINNAARATLMPLIQGFMASRVIHVAAELGVADHLAEGAKSADTLAQQTGTCAPALHRLLRTLASLGVLDEVEPGQFALTAIGQQLRSGAPGSLHHFALMFGGERSWKSWGDLLHSVRTGEVATQHVFGMSTFEYLAAHPRQSAIFNEAMADVTRQVADALVKVYDFSRFRSIVDVGGGNGTLIAAILRAAPSLHGAILDLPAGIAEAERNLALAGVAHRCDILAGDFFREAPSGADAYMRRRRIYLEERHSRLG